MSTSYYTIPTVTTTSREAIDLVLGWDKISTDARHGCLAMLISRLHADSLKGVRLVEAVVACFTCALPEMGTHIASMKSLAVTTNQVSETEAMNMINGTPSGSTALGRLNASSPPISGSVIIDDVDGLYAAVASILMALGKQAGAGVDAAVIKSRPDALISRFGIGESAQGCLPGREFGPSLNTMGSIFNTFSTYTEARMLITQFFIGIAKSIGHPPKHIEIVMTNFRLLRGTQLAHMTAIIKLMNMHPWTVRVPELTPYYKEFARELKEFEKVPGDIRQYHRMLVPQSDFLFVSSSYQPLIAVAGDFIKDVESTFAGYVYRASDYAGLIAKVRQYEPSRAHYIGTGTLAAELGVQDMELPPAKLGGNDESRPVE